MRSLCQMAAVSASTRWATRVATPGGDLAQMTFEVELSFEGVEDRLDHLTQGLKNSLPGRGCSPLRALRSRPIRFWSSSASNVLP